MIGINHLVASTMGQLGKIFGDIKQHIASALGRPLTKTPDKAVLPGPGTPEAAEVRENADSARLCRAGQVTIPAVECAYSSSG